MNSLLQQESDRLTRSWMQHEAAKLRDYLVAGVEDPRLNLQSIFTRHFLVRACTGEQFRTLMEAECDFAAIAAWLNHLISLGNDAETFSAVLHALRRGADDAEGIPIPRFVLRNFSALPVQLDQLLLPNYLDRALSTMASLPGRPKLPEECLDTFLHLWAELLDRLPAPEPPLSVLEPAAGSANDYRFLARCGLARRLDYTGFDLCETNVLNARSLFPAARFNQGNVFEIPAPDRAYDLCYVHDLFEHLSLDGLAIAVQEVCRVTRRGLCVGFFHMDEIAEHSVVPVDEYHWNTLSMERMKESFASHGFTAHVLHIGTFLRQRVGWDYSHNPKAYTFVLDRV